MKVIRGQEATSKSNLRDVPGFQKSMPRNPCKCRKSSKIVKTNTNLNKSMKITKTMQMHEKSMKYVESPERTRSQPVIEQSLR